MRNAEEFESSKSRGFADIVLVENKRALMAFLTYVHSLNVYRLVER